MVERKTVSVNWQTLFVFIPFVDLWAAYRIEKLRWYLLIFAVGFGMAQLALSFAVDDSVSSAVMMQESVMGLEPDSDALLGSDMLALLIIAEIIEFGVRIYLIRRWSREWNFRIRGYFS